MTSQPPPNSDSPSPPPAAPPPGWYRNPDGEGRRWWDGIRWTEHVEEASAEGPSSKGYHPLRYRLLHRWPLALGTVAVLAVAGVAAALLLSGGEEGDSAATMASDSTGLSASEAVTVGHHLEAIETFCAEASLPDKFKRGLPAWGVIKDGQVVYRDPYIAERVHSRHKERAARAVDGLKTFYREHPDASLPSGESTRQVLADVVTVLREGGSTGDGLPIKSGCAPGNASILERELAATP